MPFFYAIFLKPATGKMLHLAVHYFAVHYFAVHYLNQTVDYLNQSVTIITLNKVSMN